MVLSAEVLSAEEKLEIMSLMAKFNRLILGIIYCGELHIECFQK